MKNTQRITRRSAPVGAAVTAAALLAAGGLGHADDLGAAERSAGGRPYPPSAVDGGSFGFTPTTDVSTLVNRLLPAVPTGVTIDSVTLTGSPNSTATFENLVWDDGTTQLSLPDGILLCTGQIPPLSNTSAGWSFNEGQPGDEDLTELLEQPTFDAVILEITFTVDETIDGVELKLVFGSDEFPEFVGQTFNDGFGAFLDGENFAFDESGEPITINSAFFALNNTPDAVPGSTQVVFPIEYDGLTQVLTTAASLTPGQHVLKLGIADGFDGFFDSGVFLAELNFGDVCPGTGVPPVLDPLPETISVDVTTVVDVPLSATHPDSMVEVDFFTVPAVLPPGVTLVTTPGNPATGTLTIAPEVEQFGESYDVRVFALADNQVCDNQLVTIDVTASIDMSLSPEDLVLTPASPLEGQPVTIDAVVDHAGPIDGTVDVVFSVDGLPGEGGLVIDTITDLVVPAGGSVPVSATWDTVGQVGSHEIFVSLQDPDPASGDDLMNNVVSQPIEVLASPNLIVASATVPGMVFVQDPVSVTWNVDNIGGGVAEGTWIDRIYLSNDDVFDAGDVSVAGDFTVNGPVDAGGGYQLTGEFTAPIDIGDYWVFVATDTTGSLYEFEGEDDNVSAPAPISVIYPPRPNLIVSSVDVPAEAFTDELMFISWTGMNTGDAVATAPWNDAVYLSTDDVFDAGDLRLDPQFTVSKDVPAGGSYDVIDQGYLLPPTPGQYWVFVRSDENDVIEEFENEGDNLSMAAGPIDVVYPPRPNLVVSAVMAPSTGVVGELVEIVWTVENVGDADATGTWSDRVLLSLDDQPGGDTTLGNFEFSGTLAAGDSYQRIEEVQLTGSSGLRWIVVRTDASNTINEIPNEDDNVLVSPAPIDVDEIPLPDLVVTMTVPPVDGTLSGQTVTVEWTVTNQGEGPTASPSWSDEVFFSINPSVQYGGGAGQGQVCAEPLPKIHVPNPTYLQPGESYTQSAALTLPSDVSGPYYLYVIADRAGCFGLLGDVTETDDGNNLARSDAFIVDLEPQPDLVAQNIDAPAFGASGTAYTVSWEDLNTGEAPTNTGNWVDRVYLSANDAPDVSGDLQIGQRSRSGGPLGPGEVTTTRTITSVLPPDLSGTYFVKVLVDANDQVSETGFESNNVAVLPDPVEIVLSPAPDITAIGATNTTIGVPGHSISVSFPVVNDGAAPLVAATWRDAVWLSSDDVLGGDDLRLGSQNRSTSFDGDGDLVIDPYTGLVTGTLPTSLAPGTYRTIVVLDENGTLFEAGGEDNNQRVSSPFTVESRPTDLTLELTDTPSTGAIGEPLDVAWSVTNDGVEVTPVAAWSDAIYLSADEQLGAGDLVLVQRPHSGALSPGESYDGSATIEVPDVEPGTYFLIAAADSTDAVYEEAGEDNNTSVTAFEVTPADEDFLPDLQVTSIIAPSTVDEGASFELSWTVTNAGGEDITGGVWFDEVFLSQNQTIDTGDVPLVQATRFGPLAAGDSYTEVRPVTLPTGITGSRFIIVRTDGSNRVFEADDDNNVSTRPQTIQGPPPPTANLVTDVVTAPATAKAGLAIDVDWMVSNVGEEDAPGGWTDSILLSSDPEVDGGDRLLGTLVQSEALAAGESRSSSTSVVLPLDVSGPLFVIVVSDAGNDVDEGDFEGDNALASTTPVIIEIGDLANLIVTSVVAPSSATSGQSITIDWTVANVGEGATDVPAWSEVVYLSRDQIFSPSTDVFLGSFAETMALDAGSTRNRTATFELPFGLAETYYVFVATDRLDDVLELNDLDNIGQSDSTVDVILPDPADLIVSSVAGDLVAQLGENAEFTWEITNQGDTPVFGSWTDAVYLSTDGLWSIDDVRVGQASAPSGELGPGESVQLTLDASIPPVVPGTYQVIVRSDVFNQIPETDEQNNEGVAAIPTTITAIPLELDSPVIRPLPNGDEAYFALTVPAGETIEVTLEHDSLEAWTELYGRYESVPTTGQFDFRFDVPGQSTQSITIPFSEAGTYYLYARTITGAFEPDGTDATILARAIPFGIESASPPRIGQARRVTVRIEGSRFREGAAASLVGPGGTIGALRTLIVDGDTIDAGFELLDASLGTYDVLVTDPDGPVAILKNAVEIEPASPITTTVEVAGPSSMRVNSAANFTVRVRNLSNQDIDHGTLIFDMVAVEGDRIFINQLADVTVSGDPRDLTGADLSVVRNGRRSAPVHFTGLRAGGVADVTFTVVLGPGGGNEPLETGAVFSPLTSETFVDFVLETAESYRQDVLADLASYPEDFQADLLAAATDQAGWTSIWIQSQVELGVLDPFYDGEIAGQMIDGIVNDVANGIAIAATIGVGIATIVGAAPVVIGGGTIVAGVAAGIGYFWPDDPPCQCCGGGGGGGGGGGALVLQMPSGDDGDSCGERGCDRRRPIDPNEKTGPFGFDEGFIAAGTDIPYTVFFENVPEATANAAVVTIDDPLDSSLNLGTFRLGNIGFADYLVEVPADTSFFQTTLDLTDDPDRGVLLEITGGVDAATGDAFWVFTSIDPETGGIPSSPDEGFLPPNGEDGEGEGFVSFTIRPKASAVTGTVIENEAAIVFDDQEPILTNTIVLTLDADAPSSTVAGLPAITDQSQITLTWSGQDVSGGSGLTSFSIFASENGGPFLPLIEDTLEQTAVFMGEPGSTYAFYSVATDQAGNVETEPLEPDTEITFGLFALDPASDSGTVGDGLTNDATPTFLIASAPSSALVLDLVGSGYAESIPLMTDESGMVSYTVPEAIALPDGPIAAMVTAFGVTFDLALVIDTESPSVTGWAAAAEHGDLGEAVVGLPGLALASESRVGGLSTVLVTFDADAAEAAGLAPSSVSIEAIDESGAPIDLGGTSVAIAQRPGTPTYEIGFDPPLATVGLYCLVLEGVADAAGNPMTARASTVRTIVVLGGDAVGDAVVDGLDLALVDGLLGTDPIDLGDPMQVRADIDRDGAIDLDDRSLVEAALGTDLSALTRPCPAPGDVNGDGMVDVMDLLAMLAQWGECPPPPADCPADVNGDGVVDSADLLILISAWGDAGLGGAVPVRVAGPSVNDAISSEIVDPSIEILEIEGGPTRIRLVGGEVDGSAPAALPVRLRRWDVALERVLDLLLGGGGGDPAEVFTALDELGFAMSMDELVQDAARVVDGEETVFVDPVTPMVVAGDLVQTADGDLTVVLTGAAGSIPVIRVDGLAVLDGRLRVELVGGLARLDEPVVILVAERIRGRFRDVEIVGADEDTAIRIEYVEDDGPAAARGR